VVGAVVAGPVSAWSDELERIVAEVGRTRWTENNRIRLLVFPQEAWDVRLEMIEDARHHIFFSAFSWHNDHYGRMFADHLSRVIIERSETTDRLTTHLMLDATAMGVFNKFKRTFDGLRSVGVELRPFNPALATATAIFDGRMHDKMLIIDGRRAIVSGRNVSEEYYDPLRWWFDLGLVVEGDVVADLQTHYLKAWATARELRRPSRFFYPEEKIRHRIQTLWETGRFPGGRDPLEIYRNPDFFPQTEGRPGSTRLAVLYDNSFIRRQAASTDLTIELVKLARDEIDLMTPFPNFPEKLTAEIEAAAERGVRIRLYVNGEEAVIRRGPFWKAGLPTLIRLIEAGVEVWAWSGDGKVRKQLEKLGCTPPLLPPMALHGKLIRVDARLSIIHSSNFNIRSTYYNTEAGIAVLDREFNSELRDLLDRLVELRDFEVECDDGINGVTVENITHRLTKDDLPHLRGLLSGKQWFLDSMAVVW
jgi:putative cardiolipin synthase